MFEGFRFVLPQCLFDALGSARSGNDVFALRVDEIITAKAGTSIGTIACESDSRGTVIAEITEDHCLNVGGGTPVVRNTVLTAIHHRSVVHPAAKDGSDAAPKLFHGIFGEVDPRMFFDDAFEVDNDLLDRVDAETRLMLNILLFASAVENLFEVVGIILRFRFQVQDNIAVHLDESAITVPGKVFVAGLFDEGLNDFFVDADVEDGVHHTGHRFAGTRPAAQQQWVGWIAVFLAHTGFGFSDSGQNLIFQFCWIGAIVVVEIGADVGGDREASRDRHSNAAHFRQVRSFTAEQCLLSRIPVCFAITECVHVFFRHRSAFFV